MLRQQAKTNRGRGKLAGHESRPRTPDSSAKDKRHHERPASFGPIRANLIAKGLVYAPERCNRIHRPGIGGIHQPRPEMKHAGVPMSADIHRTSAQQTSGWNLEV
jgi:hypothetical protein